MSLLSGASLRGSALRQRGVQAKRGAERTTNAGGPGTPMGKLMLLALAGRGDTDAMIESLGAFRAQDSEKGSCNHTSPFLVSILLSLLLTLA